MSSNEEKKDTIAQGANIEKIFLFILFTAFLWGLYVTVLLKFHKSRFSH